MNPDEKPIDRRTHDAYQSEISSYIVVKEELVKEELEILCCYSELGEDADSQKTCAELYETFRNRNITLDNKPRHNVAKKFEDDELIKLLNEGVTQRKCAKRLRVSEPSIFKRKLKLEKQGIRFPNNQIITKKFEDDDLIQLLNKGLSQGKCSQRLGVDRKTIRRRIAKFEKHSARLPGKQSVNKKFEDDDLIQLLHKGLSQEKCAKRLGVFVNAIVKRIEKLKRQGKIPHKPRLRTSTFEDNELTQPSNDKLSQTECTKLLEDSGTTIENRTDEFQADDKWIPPPTRNLAFEGDQLFQLSHEDIKSTLQDCGNVLGIAQFAVCTPFEKPESQDKIPQQLQAETLKFEDNLLFTCHSSLVTCCSPVIHVLYEDPGITQQEY